MLQALQSSFIYDRLIISWVDDLPQPEQAAEVVDFMIRFEKVDWAVCGGVYQDKLILSVRCRDRGRAGGRDCSGKWSATWAAPAATTAAPAGASARQHRADRDRGTPGRTPPPVPQGAEDRGRPRPATRPAPRDAREPPVLTFSPAPQLRPPSSFGFRLDSAHPRELTFPFRPPVHPISRCPIEPLAPD